MKSIMPAQVLGKDRKWYIIDATGQTLGRLATLIAPVLMGKNKVDFAPHVDNGDYVIVLNADKVVVTGKKGTDKLYRTHSHYMGGLHELSYNELMARHPTDILQLAVTGMLPKNKHRDARLLRLKLSTTSAHPYEAQKPVPLV